ncbi:hypothetical protein V6R21_28965 [Limibacter armeniacum]|uniref:hypothetical protein n=1 Tax=Limibacter armeniacum TaxID=466084 RepID=UPI002FE5CE9F
MTSELNIKQKIPSDKGKITPEQRWEEQYQSNNTDDEIDLKELFSLLGNMLTRLGKGFLLLLVSAKNFISRWLLWLAVIPFIFGIGGYLTKRIQSPSYSTSALVKSEYLKGANFISEIEKLNQHCESEDEKSKVYLSNIFNLSREDAYQLLRIEAFSSDEYYKIYDNIEKVAGSEAKIDSLKLNFALHGSSFVLEIESKVPDINKEKLQQGITKYLEKSEYLLTSKKLDQENLLKEKAQIDKELKELEEMNQVLSEIMFKESKEVNQKLSTSNQMLLLQGQEKDKVKTTGDLSFKVMNEKLSFMKRQRAIDKSLVFISSLNFINDFDELTLVKVSGLKRALLGIVIGLVFVLSITLLIELNTFLNKKEQMMS